jgi:hypothetical protein
MYLQSPRISVFEKLKLFRIELLKTISGAFPETETERFAASFTI